MPIIYIKEANGNITKYGDVTYEYDKLGRLTKETNPTIDRIKEWCYDIGGNITSRTERKYTTGALITTHTYTYGNAWKDQLTSYNTQNIAYDAAGNPTKYRGATLTWQRGRLLTGYKSVGSNYTITMQYDANGIRYSKVVPADDSTTTTTYFYDGNKLLQEKVTLANQSQSSTTYRTYLYNSQGLVGFVMDNILYSYRKNLFGDIVAIYQGATKVAEYAYDAYGNYTIVSDTNNIGRYNPFRYRGYYWDNDLGLYYLMSRYYDPLTGRFINADSLEYLDPETIGGLNLYVYCKDNPIIYTDPAGTFITLTMLTTAALVGAIAGAVIGGLFGAIKAASNGENVIAGAIAGVIAGTIAGVGAGVASIFLGAAFTTMGTLVTIGSSVSILSAAQLFATGITIATVSGAIGGFMGEIFAQSVDDVPGYQALDILYATTSVATSNLFAAFAGTIGPTSGAEGIIYSSIINEIIGAVDMALDAIINIGK